MYENAKLKMKIKQMVSREMRVLVMVLVGYVSNDIRLSA